MTILPGEVPFRRILLPTDFSEAAAAAIAHGQRLARAEQARVTVVHAWQPTLYPGTDAMIVHVPDAQPMPLLWYLRLQAQKQLDGVCAQVRAELPGLVVDGALVDGAPDDEIVGMQQPGDAVVLGTHGRGALAHLFLGSVAERVVRRSTVPVLTVRTRPSVDARRAPAGAPPKRILVPIDFSEPSRSALTLAVRLAGEEAAVDVLHVWDAPSDPTGDALLVHLPDGARASLPEYLHEAAKREMHAFLAGLEQLGRIELRHELASGKPAEAILQLAPEYDLIVMGTHGRRGLPLVLLGSVAERVVRKASCPVWTVRG